MTFGDAAEPCPEGGTAERNRPIEVALRILVSFDIDGTMEFGDPPGPVPAAVARELVGRGYIVGVASDWPRSSR